MNAVTTSQHLSRLDDLADQFDMPLTFGQMSGSKTMLKIEADAAGDQAQRFFREQAEVAADRLGQKVGLRVRPFDDIGVGTGVELENLAGAVESRVRQMTKNRAQAWRGAIDQAKTAAPNQPLMAVDDMLTQMREIAGDVAENVDQAALSDSFRTTLSEMEWAQRTGGATANQINRWWLKFNNWKRADAGILTSAADGIKAADFKALHQTYAGRLSGEMNNAVEAATALTPAGTPQANALAGLKQARQQYHAASQEIRALEDDFLKTLRMDGTPQQVYERISSMDPQKVRAITDHIRGMEGGEVYLQSLRDSIFDTARFQAGQRALARPEQTGRVQVEELATALNQHADSSRLRGLITPVQEQNIREGTMLMRRMLEAPAQASKGGVFRNFLPVDFSSLAINVISRDPGFMARLGATAFSKGQGVEQLLFTREGVRTLRALQPEARTAKSMAKIRNAGIALMGASIGADAQDQLGAETVLNDMAQMSRENALR